MERKLNHSISISNRLIVLLTVTMDAGINASVQFWESYWLINQNSSEGWIAKAKYNSIQNFWKNCSEVTVAVVLIMSIFNSWETRKNTVKCRKVSKIIDDFVEGMLEHTNSKEEIKHTNTHMEANTINIDEEGYWISWW